MDEIQNEAVEVKEIEQKEVETSKQPELSSDDLEIERLAGEPERKPDNNPIKVKSDEKKNLVADTGQIVAKSGAERRIFEKVQKENELLKTQYNEFQKFLPKYKEDYDRLANENKSYANIKSICEQGGINDQEMGIAVELIKNYKNDPVATVKNMLDDLKTKGYDIDNLESKQNEDKRIQEMLDARLKPYTEKLEQERIREEQVNAFREQVEEFKREHEHSGVHQKEIVALAQKTNGNYEKAYYELRSWYERNGYDFSKSISEQSKQLQTNNVKKTTPSGLPQTRISTASEDFDINSLSGGGVGMRFKDILKNELNR